jgi:hypothetical protein
MIRIAFPDGIQILFQRKNGFWPAEAYLKVPHEEYIWSSGPSHGNIE